MNTPESRLFFTPSMLLLHFLLLLITAPALIGCTYLLLLTLLSRRLPQPSQTTAATRFDILVPAHNEAAVILRIIHSLKRLQWPADHFRIIVIADNCTDNTAALARTEGVTVLERQDETRRSKGYAVEHGLRFSSSSDFAQAVVIIDADTEVAPHLLTSFAVRLAKGANAIQANYGVLNPGDTWRTRLVTIAYSAFHGVRSRARERLGVSCGLRGNGMCFSRKLLSQHPLQVYSLAEDIEYGIQLGLAGIRVQYADEAWVNAELPTTRKAADTQRHRWEAGRFQVARHYLSTLLLKAITNRSRIALDLALDLLTLPLGYLALNSVITAILAVLLALFDSTFLGWFYLALTLILILVLHVFRGWQLSPLGPMALLDLLRAPFFIAWKVLVLLRNRKNTDWVRTDRNPDP